MDDLCPKFNELNNLVKQTIHDLKSPILALELFLRKNINLELNEKVFVTKSLKRIHEICNDLSRVQSIDAISRRVEIVDIERLFDDLSAEKSLENHQNSNISIKIYTQDLIKVTLFKLGISETYLYRILSNLVNNSVEALNSSIGEIKINAYRIKNSLVFSVIDNGPGFHPEVIKKVGSEVVSLGKDLNNHQGIALLNAFRKIDSVGGKIRMPYVRNGATIEIHLPIYGTLTKRKAYI